MCGNAANAVDSSGNPCCAICAGIDAGSNVIAPQPDLTGRKARCGYYGGTGAASRHKHEGPCRGGQCLCEMDSSPHLAFFEHLPDKEFDRYYCGCWGWD